MLPHSRARRSTRVSARWLWLGGVAFAGLGLLQAADSTDALSVTDVRFAVPDLLATDGQDGSVVSPAVGRCQNYYSFTLTTSRGTYNALGRDELVKAKHEFRVLYLLEKDRHFAEALDAPVNVLQGFAKVPWDAAKGGARSLVRPDRALLNLGRTAVKVVDRTRVPEREVEALRKWGDTAEKRRLAQGLNVDVYSRNQELQEFLTRVSGQRALGRVMGVIASAAIPPIPFASWTLTVGGTVATAEALLLDKSPRDVAWHTKTTLERLGCDRDEVVRFLANEWYTPREFVYTAEYLAAIGKVPGVSTEPVPLLAEAGTLAEARTRFQQLELYAVLHRRRPISALFRVGPVLAVRLDEPRVPLLLFPYDYLDLNPGQTQVFRELRTASDAWAEVWCAGDVDPAAATELHRLGIRVRSQVLLESEFAPPGPVPR